MSKVVVTAGDGSEVEQEITLIMKDKELGSGKCGPVVLAEVSETRERVAVKTLDITQGSYAREVEYLKTLKHCNIVKLLYYYNEHTDSRDLQYLLLERMPVSLHDIYLKPPRIPLFQIKLYMYQLLRGVAYLHNIGICHRDIKPSNMLIDPATGVLKLCDFGIATELSLTHVRRSHIGTPQYMAPELLLRFRNYTNSVDVWSVGCVLIELLAAKKLFKRGANHEGQLRKMIEVFGTPTKDSFSGWKPSYPFEELPVREPMPWTDIAFPYRISDDAVSLCGGLLCYSPTSRLAAYESLAHKFFDVLRLPRSKFIALANGNPFPPLFNFQPNEFPFSQQQIPLNLRRNKVGGNKKLKSYV